MIEQRWNSSLYGKSRTRALRGNLLWDQEVNSIYPVSVPDSLYSASLQIATRKVGR